ncbi:hypothetical protein [Candidatus Methanomethylophilus sp. 1R26]|uniref:hypothetical protein n=1 Tax=Candidatus Methanomethylophilus sp. 1R26 TaxID=1769296 RepID=UPI0012FEFF9D|nr:hypothetical protein [Candidatus Methanomethylophilus sp. 1R26]
MESEDEIERKYGIVSKDYFSILHNLRRRLPRNIFDTFGPYTPLVVNIDFEGEVPPSLF